LVTFLLSRLLIHTLAPHPVNPLRSMHSLLTSSLDVPAGTLLVIARCFEKLEKWTVGHVRALEEHMSNVERWLVDCPSDQFILHDPRTAELLNNRPLLFTPTKYTTGLCLPHLFLWRPPPTRIDQPTIYPSLPHPRQTTTITSAASTPGMLHADSLTLYLHTGCCW
jgi:hypothetical protein